MKHPSNGRIRILHNRVPERLRLHVALIKHRATLAEMLKQTLLKDPGARGIYHAEPNIATGSLLIKYHPALQTESQIVALVDTIAGQIADGQVPITAKHRNPRVSRMLPGAYFSRELVVSVVGNVVAGLVLAAFMTR